MPIMIIETLKVILSVASKRLHYEILLKERFQQVETRNISKVNQLGLVQKLSSIKIKFTQHTQGSAKYYLYCSG